MGKFVVLVLKNLGRSKVRTTLTALAVTVLVTICTIVVTVTSAVGVQLSSESAQSKLIVTERWVAPSEVPVKYLPQLTKIPGVQDWTVWNLYTGFFDDAMSRDKAGLGIATRVENIVRMHPGLEKVDPAAIEALRNEKNGCILGASIATAMNWKVGQQFTFHSTSHLGKNLTFKVVGIAPPGTWALNFFFRNDYFEEAASNKESVSIVWLLLRELRDVNSVTARIQENFRQPELKVETESAGVARIAERAQAILAIIRMVVAILLLDMVIILSNAISISTRERRVEMAVLKVLGFAPVHIMALVIGEATFVGGMSGLFGASIAYAVSQLSLAGVLPTDNAFAGFMILFPVTEYMLLQGFLLGAGVGFIGSAIPAWNARKVKVSEVFSRIA